MNQEALEKTIERCVKQGDHVRAEVVKQEGIYHYCGLYQGFGEFPCPYIGRMSYLRKDGNRLPTYECSRRLRK